MFCDFYNNPQPKHFYTDLPALFLVLLAHGDKTLSPSCRRRVVVDEIEIVCFWRLQLPRSDGARIYLMEKSTKLCLEYVTDPAVMLCKLLYYVDTQKL